MTRKRDLKRRVRERQAQTGENYTTARRRVVGARAASTVPVIDVRDVSSAAASLGFLCRVVTFPSLAERVEPSSVLASLREVLIATAGDPSTAYLCAVAFGVQCPALARGPRDEAAVRRLFRRARSGLGGTAADGTILTFHAAGPAGLVPLLCARWRDSRALVVMVLDDEGAELWDQLVGHPGDRLESSSSVGAPLPRALQVVPAVGPPSLYLVYAGRRYAVTARPFVIGRGRETADLAIKDGMISRAHAAVICRNGTFYLKDLGSTHGIEYRGMRIDNKRIDEGDVFHLGEHELSFTYLKAAP